MIKMRILSCLLITSILTGLLSFMPVNNANADTGLMLWYRFNEGSGIKVADSSGNGRDGILNGNCSWITAQNGSGAIELDGSSGYIKMPNGLLSELTETTVSARVFVDSSNMNPSWIFTFGTTTDSKSDVNAHYFGFLLESGVYRVMLAKARWTDEQNTKVNSAFSTGVWKYVTYTQKGTIGTLYVDGVKVAENTNVAYTPKDIESTAANFIGRAPYVEDKYFKGKISDFRLYNRALSSAEVVELSNSSAADIVAMDKAALNLGDLSQVTSKINLPTTGENGSIITWVSSNPSVVSSTGYVNRPKYPDTDKQVTLTATISRGSASDTKIFQVTVKALLQGQDQVIENAKKQLFIPNADDIRGNITLPSSIVTEGVTVKVTWSTDKPSIVNVNEVVNQGYDNTPAGVVTRPNTDTKVTLTAHLTNGTASDTTDLTITVKAKPKTINESDYKGYFFTYFNGTARSDAEQIYFASSIDGLHWNELNGNNPVLTSTVGDKGVRDPFIIRSPDGDKFYMVATDLRIANGKGWDAAATSGSKSVVIWESNDLINWSKERLVKVARDDAGCTWAPEIVFDEKTGEYVMFWASRIGADNYSKFRIYIAKTRDFYTFTEPKLYIERSNDVIDTTIIKHAGIYYRFSKDEVNKNILIDKCDQLLNKNFVSLPSTSVESQKGVEGPAIFKFNGQNKWCLLLDYYGGGGYYPMVSTDIASGVFTRLNSSEYKLPTGPRHGTVMPITQAEYNAIMTKWGNSAPIEEPKTTPILEYKFDETKTGNTIADTSGNNRKGTLNGNATYVYDSEKKSQVLYLDGTTDTFAAFPQGFFDGRNTVTISMDIKPLTVSGNFFTFTVGKDTNKYMFLRTRDTESRNAITINSYSNEQEVKATTVPIANKWMNIKLVITPTSMAIYKDGLMLGRNNNVSISMSDLGTSLMAYLGKSFYSADLYFKGYFDNVKVYNRAFNETEIADEFGIANKPVKIVSAEDVTVTKNAGQLPELPSKVKVNYSNGTTGSAKVLWDDISQAKYTEDGIATVEGVLYENEYENPLILNRADPCIYKHTDGYYYFTASYTDASNGHNNVGMYQYDRIVIRKASTIQGLSTATEKVIYTKAPLQGNKSPHVWAPEIHFINGNWYIYYTTTISSTDVWQIRPHVLMCPGNLDPMVKENWQDKGQVKKTNSSDMAFSGFSLDETVFEHNGNMYMVWAQNDPNSNLYIARMKDPYTIDTNAVKIATPQYDWEIHAYKVNEGPSVIKRNGRIFISYSASGTDALYCMGLLTASDKSDLLNPNSWVKTPYPVMTFNTEAGQYGPGHNTFTVSEDGSEDILVYHARQEEKYISGSYEPLYDAGRHTRVQKLVWNSDGTPNFGVPMADGKVLSTVKVKANIVEENIIKGASAEGYSIIGTKCDSVNKKATVYFSRSNSTVKDISSVPLKYQLANGCTIDGLVGHPIDLTQPVSIRIKMPDESIQVWTVEGILCNNPVLGGQFADPDISIFGDKYYIYPTTDGYTGWSGTQFHAFSSSDMINWKDEGVILDAGVGKDVPWAVGSAWAPTIVEKNGKYYFYFCAKRSDGKSCIGVATSESPKGPFIAESEPLITPENLENGVTVSQTIDSSVFTDDDGISYLLFGNGSPAIVQLNDDMISLKSGSMKNLSGAVDFRESMTVIKRNGLYHFTWSCDDTGSENYHVNYGTSNSLYGPIQYQYTVLSKNPDNNILGCGHQSIIKLPNKDEYYMAYHRFVTPLGQYSSGLGYHRETCIDKVEFDANTGLMKVVVPTLEGVAETPLNVEVVGDYNGDKTVDAIDFAYLKQYLLGKIDSFPVQDKMFVGDLNMDGEINAIDLAILKGYLLGKYDKLPYVN
ncbi:family 43 glycosylhydrolase [Ruminiclostridium josui]|uniref:cellulase n=1 Tax=Ruminiclostridium josui JCM 17888 TaxID=1291050 RepID=A0A2Z5U6M1_RUMJO|nr:family 43 glycosylhydrolase [Ruminiclostridium josui]BBA94052.1 arabinanase [Ruminiclostridium josui JCM 17888]